MNFDRIRKFGLWMGVCVAIAFTQSVRASVDYGDSGGSSVSVGKDSNGRTVYTIITTEFNVAQYWGVDHMNSILFKKVKKDVQTVGLEGSVGHLKVVARGTVKKTFDKILYSITEDAHDGAYTDDLLYLTWQYGCCDSATTYHAFNALTGKLLLAYDEHTGVTSGNFTNPFVIEVPNTNLRRLIGVLTNSATRDFKPGAVGQMMKLATLTYTDLNGISEKFDVFGQVPANWGMSTEASLVDLSGTAKNTVYQNKMTLWASNEIADPNLALQGFGIHLKFTADQSTEIDVPIVKDRVALELALLPAGFKILKAQ